MSADVKFPQGTTIGAWKVNDLLGSGGQGSVWSAKPVNTKRAPARALKVCFAADAQSRARFVQEVELLKKCDSPHILRIFDIDLEWKTHVAGVPAFAYFVAEKCKGSLEDRRKELGDCRARLVLFRQACEAVTYLHSLQEPILHRDIKPANVLIAQELGNVVLSDFGIARAAGGGGLTEAFEVVGTPYYRAPEVTVGGRGSTQSDVYCLGRLLEWMFTGDVSTDMGTRPVPRGVDLDDEACDALDRVIVKATQAVATHRFSSVAQMVEQLPDLWWSVRPRPKTISLSVAGEPVLPAAFEAVRRNDQLGWRQLENQVRRDMVPALLQWSTESEATLRVVRDEGGWKDIVDSLFIAARPRLSMALAGVYAGHPAMLDQRHVVDEFLRVPDWPTSGATPLVQAPRALVYLFHYLHGAVCLTQGQIELALQMSEAQVPALRHGEARELWLERDLSGWPKLLAGNAQFAWKYLRGLYENEMFLRELFALRNDYEVGLAAYSMLLSLREMASYAAIPSAFAQPADLRLSFPPMFAMMSTETIGDAARRTIGSSSVVQAVALRAGAPASAMAQLWPTWKKLIAKYQQEVFDPRGWPDELPLGNLALPR